MRLLEFRPRGYRNLRDMPVLFTLDPDEEPTTGCSIRFLVGVNGTGKTTLLRFLAAVFAALDEGYRRPRPDNPAYSAPFDLVYQLRDDTIVVSSTGRGRSGVTIAINGRRFDAGDFPGRDLILPTAALIYSSGDIHEWRALLRPDSMIARESAGDDDEDTPAELLLDEEESPGTMEDEDESNREGPPNGGGDGSGDDAEVGQENNITRVHFVEPAHLPLALLVACIAHYAAREQGREMDVDFDAVLGQAHISRVLGFSLRLAIEPNNLTTTQRRLLRRLYDQATVRLKQFDEQLWVFDLDEVREERRLCDRLTGGVDERDNFQPFQFFQALVGLQETGILRQTNLIVAKRDPLDGSQPERTLLAANLSDGERAFLERMALAHLLREPECLFLFDEPETHFNDTWKRELVNRIEATLTGTRSEIILTTHASITLTDAYPEEVILLSYQGQENVPLTLAAEPGDLLRSVFGADVSVGERARTKVDRVIERGTTEQLRELLHQVGSGYFRIKVVEELQRRVSSAQ